MFAPVISTLRKLSGTRTRNSFTGELAMSYRTSERPLTRVSVSLRVLTISARTHDSTVSVATLSFQSAAAFDSEEINL